MADYLGNSHMRYVFGTDDALLAGLLHALAAEPGKGGIRQGFAQRVDQMRSVDVTRRLTG